MRGDGLSCPIRRIRGEYLWTSRRIHPADKKDCGKPLAIWAPAKDDGKDVVYKIISVDNLFKAPPEFEGLIDELYNYFQDLLNRKVDEKN